MGSEMCCKHAACPRGSSSSSTNKREYTEKNMSERAGSRGKPRLPSRTVVCGLELVRERVCVLGCGEEARLHVLERALALQQPRLGVLTTRGLGLELLLQLRELTRLPVCVRAGARASTQRKRRS